MRIGIVSPIVTANPGAHAAWEASAGIAELELIGRAADRLGFHHLTCSEHVGVPSGVAEQRGATYWDPLATFGYLAAQTSQIKLATEVLVLGYHHPLEIAKRYGTLDLISGGRLVLGLGVGSLAEEFALLGAQFEGRGAIADDALAALRASLSERTPSYQGSHFAFDDFVIEPHAVQPKVPLWIGGRTPRSLRRAVTLGDGWVPFGLNRETLRNMLESTEMPDGFDVILSAGQLVDPSADPDGTVAKIVRIHHAGATIVNVTLAANSAAHYCEQLEALAIAVTKEPALADLTSPDHAVAPSSEQGAQ